MAWEYNPRNPSASTVSKIRLLIGDTDTTDQQLTDEELTFCYETLGGSDIRNGAIEACECLVAKYARLVTTSVGDLSTSYAELSQNYKDIAARLRRTMALGAIPLSGGISESRAGAVNDDADRVEPAFWRGMMDSPDITNQSIADSDDEDDN